MKVTHLRRVSLRLRLIAAADAATGEAVAEADATADATADAPADVPHATVQSGKQQCRSMEAQGNAVSRRPEVGVGCSIEGGVHGINVGL